jgi:HD superfamily phosphohydrolase YqeK
MLELPAWSEVSPKRLSHIERVTALLDAWAVAMHVPPDEAAGWHDAGRWHDALRDAPEATLRALSGDATSLPNLLHGPAAAATLRGEGEAREAVLAAIAWHTVGHPDWARTGRALYMADFLEPGRPFSQQDRTFLARQVPHDFDAVFRQVVKSRIEWTVREGKGLFPETAALWNSVR